MFESNTLSMNLKGVHMLKRIKKLAEMIKNRTSYRGVKMEPDAAKRRRFLLTAVWLGAMALFRGLLPRGTETAEAAERIKQGGPVPISGQRDRISKTAARPSSDWAGWIVGAKRGTREGVPKWVAGLKFSGISINGPAASGGRLQPSSDLKSLISIRMREAGAPQDVVEGFMGAVAESWNSWAASVRVPGAAWYPNFAVWPGPLAPPMPNTPFPLAGLQQNPALFVPPTLAAAIKSRIRDAASWPGGSDGIDEFCRWLFAGFIAWQQNAKVQGVLGTGPVPTFAPPYVPVGPVVGGTNVANTGSIIPAPTWP
jgi:hypothetical protein